MLRSLRVRLLLAATCSVVVALILAGAGLILLFENHVERRAAAELVNHLNQLTAAFELDESGRPRVAGPLSDPRFARPYGGLYWQVTEPGGATVRSRSLWDFSLQLPVDPLAPGELHRHRIAGPAGSDLLAVERPLSVGSRTFRMVVAVDRAEIRRNVRDFGGWMALSLGVLGLVLLAAAAAQVAVGLSPLRGLRRELAKVHQGQTAQLEAEFPSEVQPLVDDLNQLLAQQTAAVARGRAQAANLAHGLKSSLTALAAESRALADAGADGAASRIDEQIAGMRRHTEHQLARARAAGSSRVPGQVTPIAPLVAGLLRVMSRVGRGSELILSTEIDERHAFAGEAQDFEEMMGNLLENACKWARQRVTVASRVDGAGRLTILIDDDGPGLPAARRDEVFERGRRLDQSMPGSGLGLAIVRDIAELYEGTVELVDSPLGGLGVRLSLPTPVTTVRSSQGSHRPPSSRQNMASNWSLASWARTTSRKRRQ
jgi:signal transduction histidine kinase